MDVPAAIGNTSVTNEIVNLEPGLQHLNGAQALALANIRHVYKKNSDMNRQSSVRLIVKGIIDAILSRPAFEIPGAVADAAACVKTDMSTNELIQLVMMMKDNLVVYSGTGPYAGARDLWLTPNHDWNDALWYCYVNDDGWKRAQTVLDAGEDPGDITFKDDVVHFLGQPEETWAEGPVNPSDSKNLPK